jgi:hypothetical protein
MIVTKKHDYTRENMRHTLHLMGRTIDLIRDIMAVVTEALQTALQTLNIKLLVWMLLHGAGHW